MNRRPFQFAIALLWLTVPLVAIQYWRVWDQLPVRMATHFNALGQPNGWMSREVAVEFGIGIMAFLLVIFTPILWAISRRQVDMFAWAFLAFCGVITGVVAFGNQAVINYNLSGTPVHIGPFLLAAPAAVILSIFYFGSHRGEALPSSEVLAEETHAGRAWSLAFLPALIVPFVVLRMTSNGTVGLFIIFVLPFLFVAVAMVWSGFRYRFLKHGLEVRALGYCLRSIPRSQIQSYAIEAWNPLRGYGVRGLGSSRAFVWGNKVVHIRTTNGEVYLGHSDPLRIVRDLDLVMSNSPGS